MLQWIILCKHVQRILPSSCLWKHPVSFPRQHLKRNVYIVKSISNLPFDLIRRFEHLEFQIFRITILRVKNMWCISINLDFLSRLFKLLLVIAYHCFFWLWLSQRYPQILRHHWSDQVGQRWTKKSDDIDYMKSFCHSSNHLNLTFSVFQTFQFLGRNFYGIFFF